MGPDASAASAAPREAKNFSASEAMAFGAREGTASKAKSPELQAKMKEAVELREKYGKPAAGKGHENITKLSERQKTNLSDTLNQVDTAVTDKVGLGEAGAKKVSTEAQANIDRASSYTDKLASFLTYGEVMKQAAQKGLTKPADIAALATTVDLDGKGKKMSSAEWQTTQNAALDTIRNLDGFQDRFPNFKGLNEAQQRAELQNMLAADPKLYEKVTTKMQTLAEQANEFQSMAENPAIAEAKARKSEAEKEVKGATDRVVAYLRGRLSSMTIDENQLRDVIKRTSELDSNAPETTLYNIQQELLSQVKGADLYLQRAKAEKDYQAKLAEEANPKNTADEKKALTKQRESLEKTFQDLDKQWNDPAVIPNQDQVRQAVTDITTVTADTRGTKSSPNMLKLEVGALLENVRDSKTAQKDIVGKTAANAEETKANRAKRMQQEAEWLKSLENVLPEAIEELIDERSAEMAQLWEQKLDADDKAKAEQLDQKMKDALAKVNKAMNEKWVSYNKTDRKVERNKPQIGKYVRFLIYQSQETSRDEAVKRLIAREMKLTFQDKNPDGTPRVRADGSPWMRNFDHESMDFSMLSKEDQEMVDKVYAAKGEDYQAKLFADYFSSRCFMDKTIGFSFLGAQQGEITFGDLSLKKHEWEALNKNFGDSLKTYLENSKAGKDALAKLAEQGITPDKVMDKKKWLMVLMAIAAGAAIPAGIIPIGAGLAAMGGIGAVGGIAGSRGASY